MGVAASNPQVVSSAIRGVTLILSMSEIRLFLLGFSLFFPGQKNVQSFVKRNLSHGKTQLLLMCYPNIHTCAGTEKLRTHLVHRCQRWSLHFFWVFLVCVCPPVYIQLQSENLRATGRAKSTSTEDALCWPGFTSPLIKPCSVTYDECRLISNIR